jgi:hypothetical protein
VDGQRFIVFCWLGHYAVLMSYTIIDPTINAWTKKHSLCLFTSFADRDARFIYVSSNIGECFQIMISEPQDGKVDLNARDIETHKDEEMHTSMTAEQSKLGDALEDMLKTVYGWMRRHDASATRFIP